jgi:hypothetical protein
MAKKKIEVAPPPNARPFFKRQLPLAVLLVAAAGLYIAAGVLSGQFSLADDYGYIVQYGHYDRPLNLTGLAQMFNGISKQEMLHDYYRPIYTLIRSIDYRLYGTSPCGFHVTSLLFYLLAVGSAYWIFRKLVPSVLAAFFGALLFAFHPIHVEGRGLDHGRRIRDCRSVGVAVLRALSVEANVGEHLGLCRGGADQPAGRRRAGAGVRTHVAVPAVEAGERRRRWANLGWMSRRRRSSCI